MDRERMERCKERELRTIESLSGSEREQEWERAVSGRKRIGMNRKNKQICW